MRHQPLERTEGRPWEEGARLQAKKEASENTALMMP